MQIKWYSSQVQHSECNALAYEDDHIRTSSWPTDLPGSVESETLAKSRNGDAETGSKSSLLRRFPLDLDSSLRSIRRRGWARRPDRLYICICPSLVGAPLVPRLILRFITGKTSLWLWMWRLQCRSARTSTSVGFQLFPHGKAVSAKLAHFCLCRFAVMVVRCNDTLTCVL